MVDDMEDTKLVMERLEEADEEGVPLLLKIVLNVLTAGEELDVSDREIIEDTDPIVVEEADDEGGLDDLDFLMRLAIQHELEEFENNLT